MDLQTFVTEKIAYLLTEKILVFTKEIVKSMLKVTMKNTKSQDAAESLL